ncbi:MAG: PRC-barrel domain-containing protein [Acidimicrobiales bacterium]
MRRLTQTAGTKVVSRASAEQIGTVSRAMVDPDGHRIVALQVGKGRLVDWEALTGVGAGAVVVDDGSRVRGPEDEREHRAVRGELDLEGKLVLSDAGNELGTVADLEFDEASGVVEMVVTTEGRIAGDRLRAIGSYCVVVARAPEAELSG